MQYSKTVWLDGRLLPLDDVRVPFFTHTLHYGFGVFEGIRAYAQAGGGSAVFRLAEHVKRLLASAKMCLIQVPIDASAIHLACLQVVAENRLDACYIRPLVWMGEGPMGLGSTTNPIHVGVGAFPWGAYLGDQAIQNGIRCCVSALARISGRRHLARAKISGQYVNSILANRDAHLAGYDEAILLDDEGNVAEGPGENIFAVVDGVLVTPSLASPILPGITRATILQLARERGIPTREETFPREALYAAEEVFLTGTAAEVTPVREVDGRVVGEGRPGPITRAMVDAYRAAVTGADSSHPEWLAAVPARATA